MINAAQFRLDFPEFADTAKYPNSGVGFWLALAGQLINVNTWGPSAIETWPANNPPDRTVYDLGCELFIAHNLALEARAQKTAAGGGVPGLGVGVLQSKSVDKVSVSYDVQAGIVKDAGHWNLTIYGTRFMWLVNMAGAAPIQVGAGDSNFVGGTWPGPASYYG